MKNKLTVKLAIILSCLLAGCNGAEKPKTYTINWLNYNGDVLETDTDVLEGTVPTYDSDEPIKVGDAQYSYTFNGWSPEVEAATCDKSYIAQFSTSTNKYTITWTNYDDSILKTELVEYGQTPEYTGETPTKPSDEKYNYVFDGWESEIVAVTSDATYKAKYVTDQYAYTVNFDANGGEGLTVTSKLVSVLTSDTFEYGLTNGSSLIFRGWEYEGNIIYDEKGNKVNDVELVEGMTFVASFSDTIKISYYYNDGDSTRGHIEGPATCKIGEEYAVTVIREKGYTFAGLYQTYSTRDNAFRCNFDMISSDYRGKYYTTAINKDTEYYSDNGVATWVVQGFSETPAVGAVKFTDSDFEPSTKCTGYIQSFTSFSLTAVTIQDGYEFAGWYYEGELICTDLVLNVTDFTYGNNSYSAYWKIYSVTYQLNGGTNDSRNPSIVNGRDSYTLYAPTKEHYTFDYWTINGVQVTEIDSTSKTNYTVVAHFTPISYEITYNLDGGTNSSSNPSTYTVETSTITLQEPTKEGYIFDGWYLDEDCVLSITTIDKGSYGNKQVYAKWIDMTAFNYVVYSTGVYIKSLKDTTATNVVIPDVVTHIDKNAFKGCTNLTNIALSSNLIQIRDSAFEGCTSLVSVSIPDSIQEIGSSAFKDCSSLVSTGLGTNHTALQSIGGRCFYGCTSLTSFAASSKLNYLGNNAFYGCTSLTSANLYKSLLTEISDYTFAGCTKLSSLTFSPQTTSIGVDAFAQCSALTSLSLPSGLLTIGSNAFQECSGLTSVDLPLLVTTIDDSAFASCTNMEEIFIHGSINSIGENVFLDCPKLSIYFDNISALPEDCDPNYNPDGRPVYINGQPA